MFIQEYVGRKRVSLFPKLPPDHSAIPIALSTLYLDWSSRACTKIIELARSTGVGIRGVSSDVGVDSAPTGRKRNSGKGEGNTSADACPCAKVHWQHPVTSRSSTRAHRSSRGRIESVISVVNFLELLSIKNVRCVKDLVRVRNNRAGFRFIVTPSDDLSWFLILPLV